MVIVGKHPEWIPHVHVLMTCICLHMHEECLCPLLLVIGREQVGATGIKIANSGDWKLPLDPVQHILVLVFFLGNIATSRHVTRNGGLGSGNPPISGN